MQIPYNRLPVIGTEAEYIFDAISRRHLSGDGYYTKLCQERIEGITGGAVRLTHSCTAALEMAALLTNLKPGDEVIMPSFTFVSTANAFVLRGAIPVFVDISRDTFNIDPDLLEDAITSRTRAIVVVHYAGVCADMDAIAEIARKYGLFVIEDAAQALYSTYKGRPAGSLGNFGCFSFHETKNIVSGEGGAIVINDLSYIDQADIIREKGTNRTAFHKKTIDKYTWIDVGSSYLPSELIAAFLYGQLIAGEDIINTRRKIWYKYHVAFEDAEKLSKIKRPSVPSDCVHNGHIYYIVLPSREKRDHVISELAKMGILAPFHYVPLHSSPAGQQFGRVSGEMMNTQIAGERLVRLPLFTELGIHQDKIIEIVQNLIS